MLLPADAQQALGCAVGGVALKLSGREDAAGRASEEASLEEAAAAAAPGAPGDGEAAAQPATLLSLTDAILAAHVLRRCPMRDVCVMAGVCRRLRRTVLQSSGMWEALFERDFGTHAAAGVRKALSQRFTWRHAARQMIDLSGLHWNKLHARVAPTIRPRCNFALCAVGEKLYTFGGEGEGMTAQGDVCMVDLAATAPQWQHVETVGESPPPRWGHTLTHVEGDSGSTLVVFGGCNPEGALDDLWVLEIDGEPMPRWRRVCAARAKARARTWHSSCVVEGSRLAVYGGATMDGTLLSDLAVIDVLAERPCWRVIEAESEGKPSARLGQSLVSIGGARLHMFGGLASGSRPGESSHSDETYVINVDDDVPRWERVGTAGPSSSNDSVGRSDAAQVKPVGDREHRPTPRYDHACLGLPGGRVLIFGGLGQLGLQSPMQIFAITPNSAAPHWRRLCPRGTPPENAWGHSTHLTRGLNVVMIGGGASDGSDWDLGTIHELRLVCAEPEARSDAATRVRPAVRKSPKQWRALHAEVPVIRSDGDGSGGNESGGETSSGAGGSGDDDNVLPESVPGAGMRKLDWTSPQRQGEACARGGAAANTCTDEPDFGGQVRSTQYYAAAGTGHPSRALLNRARAGVGGEESRKYYGSEESSSGEETPPGAVAVKSIGRDGGGSNGDAAAQAPLLSESPAGHKRVREWSSREATSGSNDTSTSDGLSMSTSEPFSSGSGSTSVRETSSGSGSGSGSGSNDSSSSSPGESSGPDDVAEEPKGSPSASHSSGAPPCKPLVVLATAHAPKPRE